MNNDWVHGRLDINRTANTIFMLHV